MLGLFQKCVDIFRRNLAVNSHYKFIWDRNYPEWGEGKIVV